MEVDSVEANHNQWMEDTSSHQLLSSASPDIGDIYRDPEAAPRLGDLYQVEIPPLMKELYHLKIEQSATHAEGIVDVDCSITVGLPIPVMWVHDVVDLTKLKQLDFLGNTIDSNTTEFVVSENNNETHMNSKRSRASQYAAVISDHNATFPEDSMPRHEFLGDASGDEKGLRSSVGHENTLFGNQLGVDLSLPQYGKSNLKQKYQNKDYCPVPGSLGGPWSIIEQESFLLGLYIFGKNLVQVNRFIESKGMGDILSFYYGQFYRSEGHRRWSECRKMRSRRSIHGQRIFTGWRQHELLSRLLPRVSEECANTLLEVTKTFGEGKVSLEEYVSILKGAVGLNVLVEAIAIGKGKHDLTGVVMEPTKANQVTSSRSEIPVGKACSSLTSADIIKFLTGDFRLSKARSNDLFWEAVWPRLLARGWHSEQPKSHGYGSKNSLVFLIPGIKKFSKRKLVKGNHYFDSISDVLNKVASDPKLLELEVEAVNGSRVKEEYGWDVDTKSDQTGPSNHQRPFYLRPRVPNCNSELMKFTVVDTSLAHGEEPYKIRELRSLPIDCSHASRPMSFSSESVSDSSEERVNKPESADDLLLNDQEESCPTITDNIKLRNDINGLPNASVPSDLSSYLSTLSKQCMPMDGSDSVDMVTDNHDDRKSVKCQFRRTTKSGRPDYLSPISKRRRLNACNDEDRNHDTNNVSMDPHLKEEPGCPRFLLEVSDIMVAEGGSSQRKVPTNSSGKFSPDESSECILSENCFGAGPVCETASYEKPQPRALIDLNLPHVPPDFGMGEPFNVDASDSHDDSNTKGAPFPLGTNQQPEDSKAMGTSNVMDSAQPPVANARRQSTRNRPLTTRVLEALECGFFSTRRRGRGTAKAISRRNTMPRLSRQRARDHGGISETITTNSGIVGTDSMDSKVEGVDEECSSSYMSMLDKPQIESERKENHDLLGVP